MYLLNNGWFEQVNKIGLPYDPKKESRLYWLEPRLNKCGKRLYPEKDSKQVIEIGIWGKNG